MTRLGVLDTTVQKTHEWLRDIKLGLEVRNDRTAYAALRSTLHALRDHLGTDEVAQFGAQLPMLIRGIYYEGWNPSPASRGRANGDFLAQVRRELADHPEIEDASGAVEVVLGVISSHVDPGESEKLAAILPREIRRLWLAAAFES